MIELDGSIGEGGGQILRTSLTLSAITGQPFTMKNIRAGRAKPGLMRQHLVSVQAAAQICDAELSGAEIGSQSLVFKPKAIKGGDYAFAIGTAGSCMLVLQTVMPALLFAPTASTVKLSGGTHNPLAPPAQFLQRSYCRKMAEMGASIDVELKRFGFYPAGGGEVVARIEPCKALRPMHWLERGERVKAYAEAFVAGIPTSVGLRELECIAQGMGWKDDQLLMRSLPQEQGPGNALMLTLEYDKVTAVFSAFGEKSVRAESVAKSALDHARRYIASGAAFEEYLADQMMLPLALAGSGSFTCETVSLHAKTNATVIERFLPVQFDFEEKDNHFLLRVGPKP
jgi:RNA 3'-terminal phosphate cyclase (ATP)